MREFGVELRRLLIQAYALQFRDNDAGIDFDPILNSQDPGDRYSVRRIRVKNGRYFADVYGYWSGAVEKQTSKADVVAELAREGERWEFVNFHYPDSRFPGNENLVSILRNDLRASAKARR